MSRTRSSVALILSLILLVSLVFNGATLGYAAEAPEDTPPAMEALSAATDATLPEASPALSAATEVIPAATDASAPEVNSETTAEAIPESTTELSMTPTSEGMADPTAAALLSDETEVAVFAPLAIAPTQAALLIIPTLGSLPIIPVTYDTAGIQAAIDSASDGDTIDLSGAGGSLTLDTGALNISKSLILDGGTGTIIHVGGAFRHINVSGTVSLELDNVTLDGGNTAGGINMTGTAAQQVTLTSTGGGVIQNCVSANGGGVSCSTVALNLENITITGCVGSSFGGGIYANNSVVTMHSGLIANNTCTGQPYNPAYNGGGGVYLTGTSAQFNMYDGTISGNIAKPASSNGLGGGINCNQGSVTIYGGTISGNQATGVNASNGNGGGIYVRSTGTITIEGGLITGNSAGYAGGGVYMDSGRNGTPMDTVPAFLIISGGAIDNNTAGNQGGGIAASLGTITMTGGSISHNTANGNGNGGGINMQNGSKLTIGDPANPGAACTATISDNKGKYGGGIYVAETTSTATFSNHSTIDIYGGTISNNDATQEGGGIEISGTNTESRQVLNMYGGSITGNSAGSAGGWGGAGIDNLGTIVNISGGSITDNTSAYGGGGILNTSNGSAGGVLNLSGTATISGNNATSAGGGIYNAVAMLPSSVPPVVNIADAATISDNTTVTGGGIYNSALVAMTGGAISDNTATGNGGGTFIGGAGVMTMSGGTVSGNTAASNGGGIYTSGSGTGHVTISGDSTVTNNKAKLGGGIYNGYPLSSTTSMFTINGGTISGNTALGPDTTQGSGGGIYTAKFAKLTVANGVVFASNTAPTLRIHNLTSEDLDSSGTADLMEYGTYVATVTISTAVPKIGQNAIAYNNYDINYLGDPIVTVTYDSQGGTEVSTSNPAYLNNQEIVLLGSTATEPVNDPTKASGEVFGGWYIDPQCTTPYDFDTSVTEDITLYAKWTPLANPDTNQTDPSKNATGNVLTNDKFTAGAGTAVVTVYDRTGTGGGTLVIDPATGEYTYTPAPGFVGTDVFNYTITNDLGQTSTTTLTITVKDPPVATDDRVTTSVNTPVSGRVLGNDLGTGLHVTGHTNPGHGKVTINPDGSYTYTPDPGYTGTDSFTYTIADANGQTSIATVYITINSAATLATTGDGFSIALYAMALGLVSLGLLLIAICGVRRRWNECRN